MLLAFGSAIFLGSESPETLDHILLSQIWDFHFRRLLPLASTRVSKSVPIPIFSYIISVRSTQKTRVTCQTASSLVR
jgi:hypothetical protein